LKPIRDEFWEFKVPAAPKPNFEISQAERWAESIEKLLSDSNGMEVFTVSAPLLTFTVSCNFVSRNGEVSCQMK